MAEKVSSDNKKQNDNKKQTEIEIEIKIDDPKQDMNILDDLKAAARDIDLTRAQANEAVDAFEREQFVQHNAIDTNASRDDRLIALLCYIFPFLMSAIVMLSESSQGRPFQRYHAVQSLGLAAALSLLGTAIGMFSAFIWIIPIIGWIIGGLLFCLSPIGFIMAGFTHLYYGYQAYKGKRFAIPGVTSFLRNQGWL